MTQRTSPATAEYHTVAQVCRVTAHASRRWSPSAKASALVSADTTETLPWAWRCDTTMAASS